jgi:hypothetical protein
MDRDVVVIPTVSDQVRGIGVAASTPGHHMVDLARSRGPCGVLCHQEGFFVCQIVPIAGENEERHFT